MVPHICNGNLYTILFSYLANSVKIEDSEREKIFEGRTLLRIFKIDLISENKPEQVHHRFLMSNVVKWKNIKNAFPAIWN